MPPATWSEKKERVSVAEALWTYTVGSSQVTGTSHRRGSIEVGKLADLVVLSRDIMRIPAEQILETRVELTLVGGVIVHEAPDSGGTG